MYPNAASLHNPQPASDRFRFQQEQKRSNELFNESSGRALRHRENRYAAPLVRRKPKYIRKVEVER